MSDFETQGTAARVPRHTPRPRVSEAIVAAVKRAIHRNPRLSIRRLAVRFGATTTTVHRILRGYLKLFPYKLQLLQRLKQGDKVKRLRFCRWALSKWRAASFRDFLLMTDEAQFHLDGTVNKQNWRVGRGEPSCLHGARRADSLSDCIVRGLGQRDYRPFLL